jgi:hypothetical protein
MKKLILPALILATLPALAAAEEKRMRNTDPSPTERPEHMMQNTNPNPEQAPEHVMRNSNPNRSGGGDSSTTRSTDNVEDIQHINKK